MSPIPTHAQSVNSPRLPDLKDRNRHNSKSKIYHLSTLSVARDIPIPQLVKISDVCKILALQKSAIYNLVAIGELRRPLKFGTSRRAAARWLLSDVIHYVQSLSNNRPFSATTTGNEPIITDLV
jgi:predicted DNA-binding transcriptional regulator AlpA